MNRTLHRSLSLLALAAVAGCGEPASDAPAPPAPMPASLPGTYDGALPCANCKEIAATLWLRADERFFLRQTIVADSGAAEGSSYSFGHWRWDEATGEVVLAGRGPDRRLAPVDADRLELRSASAGRQLLVRDAAAPPFEDRVQIEGESTVTDRGASFVQCVTGLELPIADAGAFKELRRQHRALNRTRKVAFTTVEAHFTIVAAGDSTREVLVVDRVVEPIKPGKGC
jgi:hypothetical protein